MIYYRNMEDIYTIDGEHGFGIRYSVQDGDTQVSCTYYEDDVFVKGNADREASVRLSSLIRELMEIEEREQWRYNSGKTKDRLEKMIANSKCRFQPGENGSVIAEIREGLKKIRLRISRQRTGFFEENTFVCSCGEKNCLHRRVASVFCRGAIRKLKHGYIVTEQPVNKGLFLEDKLVDSLNDGVLRDYDTVSIEKIRDIVALLNSAGSPEYTRLFHRTFMCLEGYEYDAHFMEQWEYLLLALFEDQNYREVVIDSDLYTETERYEGRQLRSNRVCFKRILKEYGKVIREMDERGDYSQDGYKDFLLKYRGDNAGLLRYLASGKEKLEFCDLPYLDRIAEDPAADPAGIRLAAVKMDSLNCVSEAAPVLRKLMARLPHQEMIEIYSSLRQISLPLEEIRKLPREEQRSLVNNTPLTRDSFVYIMDDLLADEEAAVRGRFILSALPRVWAAPDPALKEAIREKAAGMPDNRLLLTYVTRCLGSGEHRGGRGLCKPDQGIPEKELRTYFDCGYEIKNDGDSFSVLFTVRDPVTTQNALIELEEQGGARVRKKVLESKLKYDDELIRKVCLAGREEEYAAALEKNRDAVDAYLFEKNNKKFAAAYRQLCEGFQEEKILFQAEHKAGIDWLVYREEGTSVLAFKVGNTKKYVVKDAGEFLSNFRSGQTVRYGKDLILTHSPDNLEEADAAMIRLLMTAKAKKGRRSDPKNKRFLTVGDSILESLFEKMAGRQIMYNDEPCLLRMDRQRVRLSVDRKYVLGTDLEPGKQEFLNLTGKGYVVSRQKEGLPLLIDRVEGTSEETGLIELVYQNPAVSIRPILKDFRKNVYSRYFELFDVDQAVAGDFKLSEIRLNTYFDYEKSAITLETKIYKNDKQIPAGRLNEKMDLARYALLQEYLTELGFTDGVMQDESRILSFFKMDFTRLKSLTNVYLSEELQSKELRSIGRPVIRVVYESNILHAFLEKSEYSEEDLQKILAAIRKKKKYILLDGNRIVDLDNETARDFADTVRDFGLDSRNLYEKKQITMVTAIKAFAHEKSCRADRYLRDMIEEIRSFKEAEIPVPALTGQLRDYQKEGYNWLTILSRYGMGGILADDMGLGKTIQVIAMIKADTARKPSLVVCPKSLVFNWISEFARFDGKTEVVEIYGPDSVRSERIAAINYKKKAVYITSYDSLRNDVAKYTGEFNYGILDEAQYIKNVHALKTRSVKELRIAHRFALTGTPIENSVVDLWSIFDYIMPGYFEELSRFRESDTADIARKAAPFILRRVKEDVLEDLPPKYERVLTAEMGQEQRRIYEAMRMEARKRLEEGGKAFDVLPYLTRLRQVCVDPGMFVEDYRGGSGKLELLDTLIPEYLEKGHRILIFSQFVKALEAVNQLLERQGIKAYFLSGATPARDRVEMMDSFNNGSGTDVFLVSLKAGGTGLNLTGADTVIHLDPWWNVAAENQASDRTHRIGQRRNVEVIRLIAGDSIEQRVVELQDIKKEVIRQVISDDDGSVTSASLEDISFVLG